MWIEIDPSARKLGQRARSASPKSRDTGARFGTCYAEMTPRFDSKVDAFDFPTADNLDPQRLEEWRALLRRSAPDAVNQLRPSFGGALEYYGVPDWMIRVKPSDAAVGAGLVLAAIDYFVARVATPGRTAGLDEYVKQRYFDFWRENGSSLLTWLAVLRKLPEEWVPRELLERRIQRQMSSGVATAVAVRIDLQLRVPGGPMWLQQRSLSQMQELHTNIAADGFCPVVVFTDLGMEVLLALEFESDLRCYDPSRPGTDRVIRRSAIQGLLCVRHSCAEPHLSVAQRVLNFVGLKRVTWNVTRAWRRRFRRVPV
jgi:hypothetical protein